MSIDYSDLFGRLGRIFAAQDAALTAEGQDLLDSVNDLSTDYTASYRDSWDSASLYENLSTYQSGLSGFVSNASVLAGLVLVEGVNADKAQRNRTVAVALEYLCRDMTAKSETVKASGLTHSETPDPNNAGNGILVGDHRTTAGKAAEYAFPESLLVRVESDSYTGNRVAGQESLAVYGAAAVDGLAWNYPQGSGSVSTPTACSPANSLVANGDFELFTVADTPDDWTISVGTAGTHVKQYTASVYDGTTALAFAGDGATLTSIRQQFGVDTPSALKPGGHYALNVWLARVGSISTGTLRISLVDSSGNDIHDDEGNSNALLVTCTGLTTDYAAHSVTFRTPRNLPTSVFIRIDLTSAVNLGTMVLIDRLCMSEMTAAYDGGPSYAVFSGFLPFVAGDSFVASITNAFGKFQLAFDRNFGMRQLGLALPSATAGSETIADYS